MRCGCCCSNLISQCITCSAPFEVAYWCTMGQWVLLVYTMNEDMRLLLLWENATLTRGVPGSIGCADVFHETDSAFSEKHPELTTKLRVFQNVLRACSYGWEKTKATMVQHYFLASGESQKSEFAGFSIKQIKPRCAQTYDS